MTNDDPTMRRLLTGAGVFVAHRCTIFLCIWDGKYIDDQHRNTNMKNKDHLGGQLTSLKVAAPGSACCRGGRAQCKMAKRQKYKEKDKKYNYRNTV